MGHGGEQGAITLDGGDLRFIPDEARKGPPGDEGLRGPQGPPGSSAEPEEADLGSGAVVVRRGSYATLRGVLAVSSGSPGSTLLTIPSGFRPQNPGGSAPWRCLALAVKSGAPELIPLTINHSTGVVSWLELSQPFDLHLDGVSFSCP